MKIYLLPIAIISITSCATKDYKIGQRFEEEGSEFYLSVAPSFSEPYEYEINSNELILRDYDGLGGYDWGKKKEISRVKVTIEQRENIRKLTILTIQESIEEEGYGEEIIVMDGTSWYFLTDFGTGPFFSYSTNNPSETIYKLRNYLNELLPNEK